jgi:hypothetical protein
MFLFPPPVLGERAHHILARARVAVRRRPRKQLQDFRQIRTDQIAPFVQAECIALGAVAVQLFLPFHHVCLAPVFFGSACGHDPGSCSIGRDACYCAIARRGTAGSAAAPATRCRKFRRGSFILPSLSLFYSITSSARASSGSGTVRPRALAVLRFMISSTFVDCTTGRSAGFSLLRIFPA